MPNRVEGVGPNVPRVQAADQEIADVMLSGIVHETLVERLDQLKGRPLAEIRSGLAQALNSLEEEIGDPAPAAQVCTCRTTKVERIWNPLCGRHPRP